MALRSVYAIKGELLVTIATIVGLVGGRVLLENVTMGVVKTSWF